jgi:hypothetical protein
MPSCSNGEPREYDPPLRAEDAALRTAGLRLLEIREASARRFFASVEPLLAIAFVFLQLVAGGIARKVYGGRAPSRATLIHVQKARDDLPYRLARATRWLPTIGGPVLRLIHDDRVKGLCLSARAKNPRALAP